MIGLLIWSEAIVIGGGLGLLVVWFLRGLWAERRSLRQGGAGRGDDGVEPWMGTIDSWGAFGALPSDTTAGHAVCHLDSGGDF